MIRRKLLVAWLGWGAGAPALACRFVQPTYSDHLGPGVTDGVAFYGQVRTRELRSTSKAGTREFDVAFDVARWLHGPRPAQVVVNGVQGSAQGTSCVGLFDFAAAPGQHWLVVGRLRGGRIDAQPQLSVRLDGAEPSPALRARLQEAGVVWK